MTDKATMFYNPEALSRKAGVKVYTEGDEWTWKVCEKTEHTYETGNTVVLPKPESIMTDRWEKGLPILHIELAKWASCLVIAPATANTTAKMSHGICDNLLTCIYAAWDNNSEKPIVIAPAMNQNMWNNNCGSFLNGIKATIVYPVKKKLACGDVGMGALADVSSIAKQVANLFRWRPPIQAIPFVGIPVGMHPGAFGAIRKHDRHCGVDLYCVEGATVHAVESGVVVSIENFTGKVAGCPWWLDTKAVKVEGASGVVCYGEISPMEHIEVGSFIFKDMILGNVIPVLPPEKLRPYVPGHSCSMLHLQLYKHGTTHKDHDWECNGIMPENIIDPTPYLLDAYPHAPRLDMT
jgi:hypothetical protein